MLGVTANFETEGALSAPTFNSDTGLKLLEGYVSCNQQSEDGELSFIPANVGEWPLRGIIDSEAELDHVLSALWSSHEEVKLAWKLNLNSEEFDRLFAVSLEVTLCFRALQVFCTGYPKYCYYPLHAPFQLLHSALQGWRLMSEGVGEQTHRSWKGHCTHTTWGGAHDVVGSV